MTRIFPALHFFPLVDYINFEDQSIAVVILDMLSSTSGFQFAELGTGWLTSHVDHDPLNTAQDHLYLLFDEIVPVGLGSVVVLSYLH